MNKKYYICEAHQLNAEPKENGRIELCVALTGHWKSRDMRVTDKHLQQMADNFVKEGRDLLFDYDHKCLGGFLSEADSRAAGWGKSIRIDSGKLYVEMEPTPRGKEMIESGEYKYLSPVYELERLDRVTGKKLKDWRLHSVALTNTPFLHELPAIKNMEGGPEVDELLKALGAEDEASAMIKLNEIKANSSKLEAEKTALAADNSAKQAKLNELEIELAVNSGKLLPAQKELAAKLLNADRALYDEFIKNSQINADLTKEVTIESGADDGLDPFAKVQSFSDLLADPALNERMEKEAPERYNKLYARYMKEGK